MKAAQPSKRPTPAELAAASGRTVRDVIGPGLEVLFCGINPGLYSGAVGHHFARPGNRFWRALAGSGFTDGVMSPFDDRRLLDVGVGITNLVSRTTAAATELSASELREGAKRLENKVRRYRPAVLAVLGLQAYAKGFGVRATIGRQSELLGGVPVFVLPNPSGLQAHYQLPELTELFAQVRAAAASLRS